MRQSGRPGHPPMGTALSKISVILLATLQVASSSTSESSTRDLQRAITFAVRQELQAEPTKDRSDVCLAFGRGLEVDAKAIRAALVSEGIKLHPASWCNKGPRGVRVGVIAPVVQKPTRVYAVVLEIVDLSPIAKGEHFGTLLKRGVYVVSLDEDAGPKLLEYRALPKSQQ